MAGLTQLNALTTAQLMARLQRHYIKPGENIPGGVFLPEVSWNGRNGRRRCDAIHVGFTSSSGQILTGHELKVSRADLLHELDDRHKADEWASQCHKWYLVVNDVAITTGIDLPHGWGLMAPGRSKTRMDVVVQPIPKENGHTPNWDTMRSIMARQDTLRANAIDAARNAAHDAARADINQRVQESTELAVAKAMHDSDRTMEANKRIRLLCDALGVHNINWPNSGGTMWNSVSLDEVRKIGEVLRATQDVRRTVAQLGGVAHQRQLEQIISQATKLLDTVKDVPNA